MAYEIGRHPGAIWRKCDLQCHTPRDHGWRPAEQRVPTTDAERARWADLFIRAARDKALSIVAITDHHDIAMLPHVLVAAERQPGGPSVLAGIEITCRDPVQCLAILDPSATTQDWERLLTKVSDGRPTGPSDAKSAPLLQFDLPRAATRERIDEDDVVARFERLVRRASMYG